MEIPCPRRSGRSARSTGNRQEIQRLVEYATARHRKTASSSPALEAARQPLEHGISFGSRLAFLLSLLLPKDLFADSPTVPESTGADVTDGLASYFKCRACRQMASAAVAPPAAMFLAHRPGKRGRFPCETEMMAVMQRHSMPVTKIIVGARLLWRFNSRSQDRRNPIGALGGKELRSVKDVDDVSFEPSGRFAFTSAEFATMAARSPASRTMGRFTQLTGRQRGAPGMGTPEAVVRVRRRRAAQAPGERLSAGTRRRKPFDSARQRGKPSNRSKWTPSFEQLGSRNEVWSVT